MKSGVLQGGKCFLGLTGSVFPLFLNESKRLSGRKIQRNHISLKMERSDIRASPSQQSPASDVRVKKQSPQRAKAY